jgi:hypothetical protein
MNNEIIIDKIYKIIEETFNVGLEFVSNRTTLNDFCPDELDLSMFRAEIDLEYWVDLNLTDEELLGLTIQEIADLIEAELK